MSATKRKIRFLKQFNGPIHCHLCGSLLKRAKEVTIDHVPASSLIELFKIPKEHCRLLPACKKCNNENGLINGHYIALTKLSKRISKMKHPIPFHQWKIQIKQEHLFLKKIGSAFVELK